MTVLLFALVALVSCGFLDPAPDRSGDGDPPAWILAELNPGDDLHQAILEAADRTIIALGPGTFVMTGHGSWDYGAILQDKTDLVVRGAGREETIVSLPADLDFGFYIESRLRNVTLEGFSIVGTLPLAVNTHAIGNYTGPGYTSDVSGLTIRNLAIRDVAVGISLATWTEGSYGDVLVTGNILEHLIGTESGWGYGIHADNPSGVRIVGNYIRNAGRHGLYFGRSRVGADILIDGNFVYEHDRDALNPLRVASALVCARSSDVRLLFNTVLDPVPYAMSVEPDETYGWPTEDVVLVGNRILGARDGGLWIYTGEAHAALGNTVVQRDGNPFSDYRYELTDGSALVPPDPRWADDDGVFDHIARWGADVFVLKNGVLDRLRPFPDAGEADWSYVSGPEDWSGARYLRAGPSPESAGAGVLYIGLAGGGFQRVDPATLVSVGVPVSEDLLVLEVKATESARTAAGVTEWKVDVRLDSTRFYGKKIFLAEWDLVLPPGAELVGSGLPPPDADFFGGAGESEVDALLGLSNRRMTKDPFRGASARNGLLATYLVSADPPLADGSEFRLDRCVVADSDLQAYTPADGLPVR